MAALRCVLAPVSARTRYPLTSRATLVASARPLVFAKLSLVQSLGRRRAAPRVQRRAIAPCAVSAPSSMAMKTYTYTELSEAERDAVCARPRIDFSSIMDIVRHPAPRTPVATCTDGCCSTPHVRSHPTVCSLPPTLISARHLTRPQGFVPYGGSWRLCAHGLDPLAVGRA